MTGRTNKQLTLRNAVNLKLNKEDIYIIHLVEKCIGEEQDDRLSEESILSLYQTLTEKQVSGIYRNRPNSVYEQLNEGMIRFKNLERKQQIKVLANILNLTMVGKAQADLKDIGGSANSGVMLMAKKINNYNEVKLINQSVTGLYQTEIDLLTV